MKSDVPIRHDPSYWRSWGANWRRQIAALAVGVALGFGLLTWLDARRIVPEDLALGVENWAAPAVFRGHRINAWKLDEYAAIYDLRRTNAASEILWVGNSQLHAINQLKRDRDSVAALHASEKLGTPVWCLSLPNENVQEQLVVLQWALMQRPVRWLVLPLVYDKLRNDGLRVGFVRLASPELATLLGARPLSARLRDEISKLEMDSRSDDRANGQPPKALSQYSFSEWLHGLSLQDVVERNLDAALSARWLLWERRSQLWATFLNDLYNLRNWALNIKSSTKRPMLKLPYENNMQAFRELLDVAEQAGVNVLIYVAPIRQDVEPPYILADYRAWKSEVAAYIAGRAMSNRMNIRYVDLDNLVPADQWGTIENSTEIDFMHFRGEGIAFSAKV